MDNNYTDGKRIPLLTDNEGIIYYNYEDMNKLWIEQTIYDPDEKHCSFEKHDKHYGKEHYQIVYVYNSIPSYARIWRTDCDTIYGEDGCGCSSAFSEDNGILQIERNFPKVAWGITAYILLVSYYDKDFGLCNINGGSIKKEIVFDSYYNECLRINKSINEKLYNHYNQDDNVEEIKKLDQKFTVKHIEEELKLLSKTEKEWYDNVYASRMSGFSDKLRPHIDSAINTSKSYVLWIEEKYFNKSNKNSNPKFTPICKVTFNELYDFLIKPEGISLRCDQKYFIDMVMTADFSEIYDKPRIKAKVHILICKLKEIFGPDSNWFESAARSINKTTLEINNQRNSIAFKKAINNINIMII